jgi:hypothetical protein
MSDRSATETPPDVTQRHPPNLKIRIDRTHYTVHEREMTGAELRQVPEPPIGPDRDLFEVTPGDSDRKIEETTVVRIKDGLRFFTAPAHINPGRAEQ